MITPAMPQFSTLAPATLARFQELVRARAGFSMDPRNGDLIARAVLERTAACGLGSCEQYFDRVTRDSEPTELASLLERVTVHETYFMRTPGLFATFTDELLPRLLRERRGPSLRIWSAACSTGEEPYSIAISLLNAGVPVDEIDVRILATDVSGRALERARTGVYSQWSFRGVAPDADSIWRHFERHGQGHRVVDGVRRMVTFERHNLVEDPYPTGEGLWDIVFLRNVLIYFDTETADRVLSSVARALRPGGIVLLGECESLLFPPAELERRQAGGLVTLCRRDPARPEGPTDSTRVRPPALRSKARAASRAATFSHHPSAPLRKPSVRVSPRDRAARVLEIALGLIASGDPQAAIPPLTGLVEDDERNTEARLALANACVSGGDYERAREQCRAVLEVDPANARAHTWLGISDYCDGRPDAALTSLRGALCLDQDVVVARYFLARVQEQLGETARARANYGKALVLLEGSPCAKLEAGFERAGLLRAMEMATSRG